MSAPDFDLKPLFEAVSGDREVMCQVLSMFISSSQDDVKLLRDALAKNDSRAVKSTAHHLKGSLLEIDAKSLVAIALRLEQMGSAGDLTGALPFWQELDAQLSRLIHALDQTDYRRTA